MKARRSWKLQERFFAVGGLAHTTAKAPFIIPPVTKQVSTTAD